MSFKPSNRKRIRGWPEMVRKLDRLEKSEGELNRNQLLKYGWDSYELLVAPFSNYTRREPPGWYARLYFESMFRVASAWKKELENEEHYLAVWFFYPRFSMSQVVAAVGGDTIEYYRNRFRPRSPAPRFPDFVANYRLSQSWKTFWDYQPYYKVGDELTNNDVESLRRRHAVEEKDAAETVYQLPHGTVWIFEESAPENLHPK